MQPVLSEFIGRENLILPYAKTRPWSDIPDSTVTCPSAVARAEELLGKPIPALPASLYRQYYENGNRTGYETPYFERRRSMLMLAAAEKTEGKGRFLDLLVDYIWAVCEETTWVIPAHSKPRHDRQERLPDSFDLGEGDDQNNIDLFSAATGAAMAMVWYLLHDELDALTPVISRRMLGLIDRRIFHPFMVHDLPMWWKGTRGNTLNNWTPWIISNILTMVLLCEKDDGRRQSMCEQSMVILDRFIRFYKDDGGCDEGPGYWSVAGASYFDCLELLWDLSGGVIDVFDLPLIRRMGEYIADFHITGNLYVNFADASHRLNVDTALIARYGRRTGSVKLTAFAGEMMRPSFHGLNMGSVSSPYRIFRNMLEPLPEKLTREPENRTYYEGLEVFIARDPASGLCLAYKGGHNNESHNHNDVGSIVLFRGEHPVFIDSGVEQYTKTTFSDRRYTLWTMRSSYHNLPEIGGAEQKAGSRYRAALLENTGDSVCFDLIAAWPEDAGIRSYTRRVQMDGSRVTLTDTLALETAKDTEWFWLCAEKPVICGDTLVFPEAGCRVHFSCGTLTAEEFPLTDGKLRREWQSEVLYRIHLLAENWQEGTMCMTVHCEV